MLRIAVENGRAKVYTPYNPDFVSQIKTIGGHKWDSTEKCWTVPAAEIDTVRKCMMNTYGETDILAEGQRITVRVRFNKDDYAEENSYFLFGKMIARAWGRDSGAIVGDDVVFDGGKPISGGSMRHWRTVIPQGCVIRIKNVPQAAFEAQEPDKWGTWTAEKIEDEEGVSREALEEEKAKLLARLAEIEKLLSL